MQPPYGPYVPTSTYPGATPEQLSNSGGAYDAMMKANNPLPPYNPPPPPYYGGSSGY